MPRSAHRAELRCRSRRAEPEERQARQRDDERADVEARGDERRGTAPGQQVAEHEPEPPDARQPRGLHVGPRSRARAPRRARCARTSGHHTIITAINVCQSDGPSAATIVIARTGPGSARNVSVKRMSTLSIQPAGRARHEPDEPAEQHARADHEQRRQPRRLNAEQHAREDVAPDVVGAEQEAAVARREERVARRRRRRVRGEDLGEDRDQRDHARTRANATRSSQPTRRSISNCGDRARAELRERDRERFGDGHQPHCPSASRSGIAVEVDGDPFESPSWTRRHETVRPSSSRPAGTGADDRALVVRDRAPRVERAARSVGRCGLAGSPDKRNVHARRVRAPSSSRTRRVRVHGRGTHVLGRTELDDTAEVHHRDPVGDDTRRREVVRDEQHRHAELAAQPPDQVERGRGERHVERARGLVAQQQCGRHDDRARERGALALPAGQLSRFRGRDLRGEADERERFGDALAAAAAPDVLVGESLADQLADRHPRSERRARVLEDDLRARALADDDVAVVVLRAARRRRAAASTCRTRTRRRARPSRRARPRGRRRAGPGGCAAPRARRGA